MGCASSSPEKSRPATIAEPSTKSVAKSISSSTMQQETPRETTSKFGESYQLGDILGQGSYSVVRNAVRIADRKGVAVKIVTRSKLSPNDESNLRREVGILLSLDHPNIVKVLDFFEEERYFYVVLEKMCGGELFDRLIEKATYTEGEARDLALVLLNAIKYIHDRDIVHRDIKPENILLVSRDNDVDLKLADFGFAVQSAGPPSIKQQAGTPGYISPEVIEGRPHGKPVDMWSMGVVLYMLLGGYPPFYEPEDDQKAMFRKIVVANFQFHSDTWDVVSEEAKDLIRGLLTVDQEKRLSVDQALNHPWIGKPREELEDHNIGKSMVVFRAFRDNYFTQFGAFMADAAITVVRQLSGATLTSLNDVAISVTRKLSGGSLTEVAVESARRRASVVPPNAKSPPGKGPPAPSATSSNSGSNPTTPR